MQAAIKGAGEIGFTIISISVSLVAVFIPLLLMGGIVGRLLREFAVTVSMTIVVSLFVSLTLTPMMCARLLKDEHTAKHGRLYMVFERGFDAMLDGYRAGLDLVLAPPARSPWPVSSPPGRRPVALFIVIPKGFFPQQDTGVIVRHDGCRPGHLVRRDGAAADGGDRGHVPRSRHRELGRRHRRRQPRP